MSLEYCINGRFLTRSITGVDRYAREIVRELDSMLGPGSACILVPERAELVDCPSYSNLQIKRYGPHMGHIWEQVDLYSYAKGNRLLGVNLCNTAPIRDAGIVCIHDMNVRANPKFYSWKFRLVYRALFGYEAKTARVVLTDSNFSKGEIEKYYPAARGKIDVIPCAWQHVERVEADPSVLARAGLEQGSFYFAMSSLAPNKNLRWLVETARLNPSETLAVAGGINSKVFGKHDIPEADNVRYLGYVTDGEAKALMQGCKGFLYPTFYEGFGIPPMEAMACGAPVAVSDTEVMREVYGDAVHYVDPHEPCGDLTSLLSHSVCDAEVVLNLYSWEKTAQKLYEVIKLIAK